MFSGESISDYLERYKENLRREIKSNTAITNINLEEYEKSLVRKYSLEVPVIDEEGIQYDTSEEYDNGFARTKYYEILVPYKGNGHIFEVRPTTYTLNPPFGDVEESQIKLKIRLNGTRVEKIREEIENNLENIKKYLEWAKSDVEKHNEWVKTNAPIYIKTNYNERKQDYDLFSSLGFAKKEKKIETVIASVNNTPEKSFDYDVFICHASEDKEDFVDKLARKLIAEGLSVWYDDFALSLGDSLRRSIDRGLTNSKYGIVILSKHFFEKEWPQKELDGLVQREVDGRKVILPIWHNVDYDEVVHYSPMLADKLAVKSNEGLEKVVESILRAIRAH